MRPFVVSRSVGVSAERRGHVTLRDLDSPTCRVTARSPPVGSTEAVAAALAVTDDGVWVAERDATVLRVLRHPTDPRFARVGGGGEDDDRGAADAVHVPAPAVGLHAIVGGSAPWLWRRPTHALRGAVVAVFNTGAVHIFDAHARVAIVTSPASAAAAAAASSAPRHDPVTASACRVGQRHVTVVLGTASGRVATLRFRAPDRPGAPIGCVASQLLTSPTASASATTTSTPADSRHVTALACASSSPHILVGTAGGRLMVLDPKTGGGGKSHHHHHQHRFAAASSSSNGSVVAASWQGEGRDAVETIIELRPSAAAAASSAPLFAAIDAAGRVTAVDAAAGFFTAVVPQSASRPVRCAASDPKGRLLLLLQDGSARLLELGSSSSSSSRPDGRQRESIDTTSTTTGDDGFFEVAVAPRHGRHNNHDEEDDFEPSPSLTQPPAPTPPRTQQRPSPAPRVPSELAPPPPPTTTSAGGSRAGSVIDDYAMRHILLVFRALVATEEEEAAKRAATHRDEADQRDFLLRAHAALSRDISLFVVGGTRSAALSAAGVEERMRRSDVELDAAAHRARFVKWAAQLRAMADAQPALESSEAYSRVQIGADADAAMAGIATAAAVAMATVAHTGQQENAVLADEFKRALDEAAELRAELAEATQRWRAEVVKAEGASELQRTVDDIRGQRDEALDAARSAQRTIRERDVDLESAGSALERQRAALLATEHDHLFAFEDSKRGRVTGQWAAELAAMFADARAAMALHALHALEMTAIAREEGDRLALSVHDLRRCMSQAVSSEAELKDDVATLRAQRQDLEAEVRTFRERAAAAELREQSLHAKVDRAQSHLASMAEELQAATRRADTSSRVAEDSMSFSEEQQAALHALRARASSLQSAANSIAAELETLLASPGSGEPPGVSEARALLRDAMYDLADCRRTDGLAAASSQSLSAAFERIRQAQECCFPRSFEAVCWARNEAIAAVRRVREAVDGLGI